MDQYGEMVITNQGKCSCKLNFVKVRISGGKKNILSVASFPGLRTAFVACSTKNVASAQLLSPVVAWERGVGEVKLQAIGVG